MSIVAKAATTTRVWLVLLLLMFSQSSAQPGKSAPDRRPTVAVLYFDYSGEEGELSFLRKALAQMLISDLAAVDEIRVVERARLEALISEMKLNRSTRFDLATGSRIGKLLGARYMVLGNYQYLGFLGTIRINADFVDVETGVHVSGTSATGKPDEFLVMQQKISAALAKSAETMLAGRSADREPSCIAPPRRPRVKPPAQLKLSTAVQYAKALDAIDRGDRSVAKIGLQAVKKEQPDFALAAADYDALVQ